mmetsp:Transcript_15198/g.40362  ORF Transcript_15198/g.40362 Transcript_15198/m.40362 type:complete len:312 (+) Transcript_15198:1221-2156(+)
MAATMVEKLSSAKTMSDACWATAVPWMPMATPIAARFSAGASLTPSPVMEAMWPIWERDSMIATLSVGWARAQQRVCATMVRIAPSSSRVWCSFCCSLSGSGAAFPAASTALAGRAEQVLTRSEGSSSGKRILTCLPMAAAVACWSPVIMTTRMPALWHSATLGGTEVLGGSKMPKRPKNTAAPSMSSTRSSAPSAPRSRPSRRPSTGTSAMRRLRSASRAKAWFSASTASLSASLRGSEDMSSASSESCISTPPRRRPRSLSGAPFTMPTCPTSPPRHSASKRPPLGNLCTVAAIFREDVNGTSSSCTRS